MFGFKRKECICEPKRPYRLPQDTMALLLQHFEAKVEEARESAASRSSYYEQAIYFDMAHNYEREVAECKRYMMQEWPLSYRDFKS